MAYVQVEADDVSTVSILPMCQIAYSTNPQQRLEEGPEGLQFKCMRVFSFVLEIFRTQPY